MLKWGRRMTFLGTMAVMAQCGVAKPLPMNPHDVVGAIRRFERSFAPEAKAIVRQIRNGPHDRLLQRAAAQREGIPLTPAELEPPLRPDPLDAAPLYKRLYHLLRAKPLDERAERLAAWLGVPYVVTEDELDTVRKLMEDRHDVMDLIHQAVDKPRCRFRHTWNLKGVGDFSSIFAPLEGAHQRRLVRLIHAESYLLARGGHFEEAIANQARGFRLAEHAAFQPTTIACLVGIACDAMTLEGMKGILYLAGPNAEIADRVRQAIAESRPRYSLRRTLEGEFVFGLMVIDRLRRSPPHELAQALADDRTLRLPKPTAKDLHRLENLWDAVEAEHIRRMRGVIALAGKASVSDSVLRQVDWQSIVPGNLSVREPVRLILGKFVVVPFVSPVAANIARAHVRAEAVMAAAAVLAYRARQGSFPDRLEQAVERVPVDPFSGQPLHYQRAGDGFLIAIPTLRPTVAGRTASEVDDHRDYFRYPAPPPVRPEPLVVGGATGGSGR